MLSVVIDDLSEPRDDDVRVTFRGAGDTGLSHSPVHNNLGP